MKRPVWLIALILYAAAGVGEGARHIADPLSPGVHSGIAASLTVAFCAGLFWPIDVVARPLLR